MAGTTQHRGRMHPDQPHSDFSRDPILDGRDSLRLVKLRLALTLITVAILPIAAVSPLVRAAAEGLPAATSAPDTSSLVLVTLPDTTGPPRFELITVISLPALLNWSSPTVKVPGQTIGLIDDAGVTVATYRSAFDPTALPGQV